MLPKLGFRAQARDKNPKPARPAGKTDKTKRARKKRKKKKLSETLLAETWARMSRSVKIKCCRYWGFACKHAQKYRSPQKRRAEKCLKPGTARKTALAILRKNEQKMLPKLWFRAHASPKNPQAEQSRFKRKHHFEVPNP